VVNQHLTSTKSNIPEKDMKLFSKNMLCFAYEELINKKMVEAEGLKHIINSFVTDEKSLQE